MGRFKEICNDGLLGPGDHGIFKDWSAIDRSRDGYIRIRDGLVSEGEVQEMEDEENFYNKGPYQARAHFLGVPSGGCLPSVALVLSNRIGAL
jgi:hypothetical protein